MYNHPHGKSDRSPTFEPCPNKAARLPSVSEVFQSLLSMYGLLKLPHSNKPCSIVQKETVRRIHPVTGLCHFTEEFVVVPQSDFDRSNSCRAPQVPSRAGCGASRTRGRANHPSFALAAAPPSPAFSSQSSGTLSKAERFTTGSPGRR